jgi:hypothetical protein
MFMTRAQEKSDIIAKVNHSEKCFQERLTDVLIKFIQSINNDVSRSRVLDQVVQEPFDIVDVFVEFPLIGVVSIMNYPYRITMALQSLKQQRM